MNRRQFLKANALALAGGTVASVSGATPAERSEGAGANGAVRDTSSWFPFEFPLDDVNLDSIDLSGLLDAPAGKHGFLATRPDGHFYFEDGTRARFFGTEVVGRGCSPEKDKAPAIAARLAKYGANMLRFHAFDSPSGRLIDHSKGNSQTLNAETLDRIDYFISELKKKGIYAIDPPQSLHKPALRGRSGRRRRGDHRRELGFLLLPHGRPLPAVLSRGTDAPVEPLAARAVPKPRCAGQGMGGRGRTSGAACGGRPGRRDRGPAVRRGRPAPAGLLEARSRPAVRRAADQRPVSLLRRHPASVPSRPRRSTGGRSAVPGACS